MPPTEPATQTFTFVVYPDATMEVPSEGLFYDLDIAFTPMVVDAGAKVTVRTSEFGSPMGFPWKEPTEEFECLTIVNKEFGGFQTGWSNWLLEAKMTATGCQEVIVLHRPEWWATGEMTAELHV